MSRVVFSLALCLVAAPAMAVPLQDDEQTVEQLLEQANGQLQQQDFAAAAVSFKKVVQRDKTNGRAWHLLGYSLHASGDLAGAINAHLKATEFPDVRGVSLYNLGCAYALMSKKDKAFHYLNQAVKAGFTQQSYFETDTDLDTLRDDVRFARVSKRVRGESVTDDFTAADLAGRWIVESEMVSGAKNKDAAGTTIEVTKKAYVLKSAEGVSDPIEYKVDTSKVVPTIQFSGSTGIMMLDGDRLTLAYVQGQDAAPKALASTEANRQTTLVLRRALTRARLAGQWEYVSGMRAGEVVPKDRLQGVVTVTKKNFTMPAGPDDQFVMGYELSNSGVLDAIDLVIEAGPVPAGSKAVGVIKVEGDLLTLCYDGTGARRPQGFKSTEDNAAFLFVLKRKAKTIASREGAVEKKAG